MTAVLRLALPFVLGLLAASGQAPFGFWWLTLPALSALAVLVASASRRRAVLNAWAAGAGYFGGAMFWIVEPFLVEPEIHGWMAPFALFGMAGGMALFWALSGWIATLAPAPERRALAFGVAISATDIVRTYILTGFPWAAIGHVWIDTPVAQAGAWIGTGGLSLLTGLAAALPLLTEGPRGRLVLGGLSLAVIGALWLAGAARLAAPQAPRDPAIHVRLVQPNATQALKWQEGMWQVFLERLFAQTEAPPAPGTPRPDLIVWPETSVPVLLENAGPLLDDLVTAAQGASVTLGIQRAEGARFYNSLVVMDREGAVTHIYDKHHLTPFGEYIPLGDFAARFGISAFAAQAGNGYSAGPGPAVLDLGPLGRVLPLICYEAIFPQGLRTNDRPDWILMITNDAWFGNLAGPYQHLAQVRLRAIEQGLPVLRSANTGVSAVIDAKGRNLASTALNTEGFLDAPVPAALPATPYARWGDLPATILVLLALLALIVPRRRAPD